LLWVFWLWIWLVPSEEGAPMTDRVIGWNARRCWPPLVQGRRKERRQVQPLVLRFLPVVANHSVFLFLNPKSELGIDGDALIVGTILNNYIIKHKVRTFPVAAGAGISEC
jgi:hypothetical protein